MSEINKQDDSALAPTIELQLRLLEVIDQAKVAPEDAHVAMLAAMTCNLLAMFPIDDSETIAKLVHGQVIRMHIGLSRMSGLDEIQALIARAKRRRRDGNSAGNNKGDLQ